jgi:hypothetical protein
MRFNQWAYSYSDKEVPRMPESITQSDIDYKGEAVQTITATPEERIPETEASPVIWTPRFIIVFALTVVIGLSAESLLTQGYVNGGLFVPGQVLAALTVLILAGWVVLLCMAYSPWLRIGSIFGCVWSIFAGIGFIVSVFPLPSDSPVPVHLTAATNSVLLGAYICLSVAHTSFQRWDSWFFRLAPLLGASAVTVVYLFLPPSIRTLRSLEITTSFVMLFLCLFTWWLRPSCWRSQPGLTFLFGITPFILLMLAIPGLAISRDTFFFTQVALLSMLLGIMRVVQGERQHR